MAAIGEIRVNFLADTAKFISPINKATTALERFALTAARRLDSIERAVNRAGNQLTLKVTAPLAALSYASVKAADAQGDFANSLQRTSLQARAALKPLGEELIRQFEKFKPQIDRGILLLNGLTQAFRELSPETKETVVRVAAIAAVAGPALVALGGFLTVAKIGATGLGVLASAAATTTGGVLKTVRAIEKASSGTTSFGSAITGAFPKLAQFAKAAAVAGIGLAALGGFEVGKFIEKEFGFGTKAVAYFNYYWDRFISGAGLGWDQFVIKLDIGWQRIKQYGTRGVAAVADSIASLLESFGSVSPVIENAIGLPAGTLGSSVARTVRQLSDGADIEADKIEDVIARLKGQYAGITEAGRINDFLRDETLGRILESTDQRLDEEGRRGAGGIAGIASRFKDQIVGDIDAASAAIGGFLSQNVPGVQQFQDFLGRAREIAGEIKLPEVVTPADRKQIEDLQAKFKELKTQAIQVRLDVIPEEDYALQVYKLQELKKLFPEIIDSEVFAKKMGKIKDQFIDLLPVMERIGRRFASAIENSASSASDALADFVITGERNITSFLKTLAQQLLSIGFKESIFGPLFKAAGQAVGNAFSGGGTTAGSNPTGPVGEESGRASTQAAGLRLAAIGPSGGVQVQIIDQRGSGAKPEVTETTSPGGGRTIRVLIRDEIGSAVRDGTLDKVLQANYGIRRRGARF